MKKTACVQNHRYIVHHHLDGFKKTIIWKCEDRQSVQRQLPNFTLAATGTCPFTFYLLNYFCSCKYDFGASYHTNMVSCVVLIIYDAQNKLSHRTT